MAHSTCPHTPLRCLRGSRLALAAATALLLTGFGASAAPVVFSGAGATAADIQATVDAFRSSLGTLNANGPCTNPCTPGVGRREVNWDGVPDAQAAGGGTAFGGDFFNLAAGNPGGRVRGIQFSTGGSLAVSASTGNPSGTATLFGNFSADNAAQFAAFSPERIFGLVNATTMDVTFAEPGSPGAPATVRGFGAVFTDVEIAGDTTLAFYDLADQLLLSLDVATFPFVNDSFKSFSFAGATWDTALLARVRITAGSTDLTRTVGTLRDVVAMDDFIYGEPERAAAVPESGSLSLAALALLALSGVGRRVHARVSAPRQHLR